MNGPVMTALMDVPTAVPAPLHPDSTPLPVKNPRCTPVPTPDAHSTPRATRVRRSPR